ncbi:thrombospondin-2-like [Mya arenaria]|uniref:thrombospondin-2-like n=1 Tax=Mya arenaria TaxID=6604 RepID=UPI0022DEE96D|nr:thrombospondin-2-like [Mya arenaria]
MTINRNKYNTLQEKHYVLGNLIVTQIKWNKSTKYMWNIVIDAVNGFFSNWSTWTTCSVSCGNGTRVRERLCDNPQPQHNGSTCTGDYKESEDCFTGILCPKILCYHCNSTSHKFCDQGNFDSDKYSYDKIYISDGELCVKCTKGYKGGGVL